MKTVRMYQGLVVLSLVLATAQAVSGQPPQDGVAPPAQRAVLPSKTSATAVPERLSKDNAGASPARTQAFGPSAPVPAGAPPASVNSEKFRLRAEVNLVQVEATVRDRYGSPIDNLGPQDFRLYEDGVEQRITYFSRDELPLAVALVLDRSGSMGPVLKQLHHVAYQTFSLLKPEDEMALFDFAARAEQLVDLTTDRQRVADGIARIHARGATVIADALFEAALYLAHAAPERRHAIILVSDNENTLRGYANESRVIRQALEAEAVIYSIRVREGLHPQMMQVLLPIFRDVSVPEITRQTGGEVIDARNAQFVPSAMATVISRLKRRYTLGYYSTNPRQDGGFRQIGIRVSHASDDGGYTVYARRGYYARTEHPSTLSAQPFDTH